jgi:type III restriction enzyme
LAAVKGLVDKLVDMGFDEGEVAENIEHAEPQLLDGFFGRKPRPTPNFILLIICPQLFLVSIKANLPDNQWLAYRKPLIKGDEK